MMEHWKNISPENIVEEIDGIVYTEMWRSFDGYEGLYEVSTFGRIKCLERRVNNPRDGWSGTLIHERIMKQSLSKIGYLEVKLSKNGKSKSYMPHRIVANTFIENPENKPQVNHLYGIKTDNRWLKLEWATRSEDQLHAYRVLGRKSNISAICDEDRFRKRVVCTTLGIQFNSIKEATEKLGIYKDAIKNVCSGKIIHVNGLVFRHI